MGKIKTYLEFGYMEDSKRHPYLTKENQDAYDFFMTARYLKDIISYRNCQIQGVHHEEDLQDNIKKYSALCACSGSLSPLVYYEVGSSLMGVIDSLEFINKKIGKLNVKDILFMGVDNSRMMNTVAYYIHPSYKLALFEEKAVIPCDLFFAKGVSLLYAFEDEGLFCNILKNSRLAIFDYTFSLKKESVKDVIVSGKMGTYLSLDKCKKLLNSEKKQLVLQPSERKFKIPENRKLYECIYGDKELVKKYMRELNENKLKFGKK